MMTHNPPYGDTERGGLLVEIFFLENEIGIDRAAEAWLGCFSHEMTLDDLEVSELRRWKLVLLEVDSEMHNEVMV